MEEELLSTIMTIIMKSGQAKDACYRALQAAKKRRRNGNTSARSH